MEQLCIDSNAIEWGQPTEQSVLSRQQIADARRARARKRRQLRLAQRAFTFVVFETDRVGLDKYAVGSGFLCIVAGQPLWITAGHVLEQLDKAVVSGKKQRVRLRNLGSDHATVELDYAQCERLDLRGVAEIHRENRTELQMRVAGIFRAADVGCIFLSDGIYRLLYQSGARPFRRKNLRMHSEEEVTQGSRFQTFIAGVPGNTKQPPAGDPLIGYKELEIRISDQEVEQQPLSSCRSP